MIFRESPLKGAFVVEVERLSDDRGFFARTFCQRDFEAQGLSPATAQCNISFNHRKGTVRGLHFQQPPHEEAKVVRVTRGAIFDAIVDLRPSSPTFLEVFAITLSAEKRNQLYIPKGFAHGFQTLEDDSEVFYQMSDFFQPGAARGYRWNDPAFAIEWPLEVTVISERDQELPLWRAGAEPGSSTES
ncbi:MAG: dTDP-4-dehydrorhamnose 3,5-epimerase [Deltaproteobacteria bacterium]|nr:dTDP-4-dehydrorhamnose 3,5-epimerase [Deltaproteobacteria bacterium]